MRIKCIACGEKAVIRSSEEMSQTIRRAYCSCRNVKCGHTFALDVTFSHSISPSAFALPPAVLEALQSQRPGQIALA